MTSSFLFWFMIMRLHSGLGVGDDGRTEAVDITAPIRVPVQHSTGGSSSGGCGHDGRTHQGGSSSWGNGCFWCGEMEHKARDCNEGDQVVAGMLP
ncbi:hypothetical protein RHGRI_008933 [Rhododendron griersonianum]|uniref:CCHC-type domain-containing protein n=1 Tax=Rhododendron griersonianum TaxID=479676 RepID=A0AAV6L4J4_9ERIC|nr:hypothetical protein RHGRI_008933 [Rhododendron griersonianum]